MSIRFGRYEAVGKLGEGAMAAVHLARDPVLTRYVAVKVLHRNVAAGKTALQRFFNEAKTVARLQSPHVVEVFDFGKQGRDYFLVMEFMDGRSLRGVLEPVASGSASGTSPAGSGRSPHGQPGQPLPDEVTASLLCQAAEGLEMAARHGVVHRDIKPENLMVNSQGYLKIADFGIAHLQDDSLTRTGAVLGSPLYMSPEQVRGAKPITSQSDMYSLGAVFYRCLTGVPPFTSSTLKDLFRKIAQDAPAAPGQLRPGMDPDLARLVETLLQKDPARRGGGPRWLRSELRAWLLSRGVADPMERVCHHMRELSGQIAPGDWLRAGDADLPRTVVSSSPMVQEEAMQAYEAAPYEAASTVRDSSPRIEAETDERMPSGPSRRWAGPGSKAKAGAGLGAGPGAWIITALLVAAFAAALGAGAFVWARIDSKAALDGREGPGTAGNAQDQRQGGRGGGTGTPAEVAQQPTIEGDGAAFEAVGTEPGDGKGKPVTAMPMDPPGTGGGNAHTQHTQDPDAAAGNGAESGILVVQSAPPFAQVFLDGNEAGVAPVTLANLSPGFHRLVVKGRSGAPLDTVLRVQPGRRVLRVRLDPETVALESGE